MALLFLGPAAFFFFLIVLFPFLSGIYYSFTEWNGVRANPVWIGFENFRYILNEDPQFLGSFWFTLQFTVVTLFLTNFVAYGLALILIRPLKGAEVMRTLIFLPNMIGGVLLGFVWRFILINGFQALGDLTSFDFFNQAWLGTPETGFWGLVIVYTWQSVGYLLIIYVAHLKNIDTQILEAAQIDGVRPLRMFWNIILPLSMPAITVGFFLVLSWTFKSFDIVLSLTAGGPFRSTETVALNIYREAFAYSNFGRGAAKSLIYFIVVGAITYAQVRFTKSREIDG